MPTPTLYPIRFVLLALVLVMPPSLQASDLDVVKAFYSDLLSNPRGDDLDERVRQVVIEDTDQRQQMEAGLGAGEVG